MRRGEILNLKWENVDLKHGFILLEKTKNGERREIPMNEALKQLFRQLFAQRRLDTDYIFVNPQTGKRYTEFKRSFHTALRKAGIRDFRFHDLRHTFASQLVMNGVDLKTVQELLGHKYITMTMRYSHLSQAHKKEAVRVLENLICHNFVKVKITELCKPLKILIGASGFEPPTPCSQGRCAIQAALRPDNFLI